MAVVDGSIVSGADVKSILGETTTDNDTIISLSIRRAEGAAIRYLKYDPVQRSRTEFYPQSQPSGRGPTVLDVTASSAVFRHPRSLEGNELQLRHVPIRSGTPLDVRIEFGAKAGTVSGSFAEDTKKTEGEDFWPNYDGVDSAGDSICLDGIIRSFGSWPGEAGSVKIVYTAGYSAAELEGTDTFTDATGIWDAVLEESVQRSKKAIVNKKSSKLGYLAGPLISERLGDYNYKVSDKIAQELFGAKSMDLLPSSIDKLNDFVNYGYQLFS